MGLDVSAYRRLACCEGVSIERAIDEYDTYFHPASMRWSESHWPGRAEGLDAQAVYTFAEEFCFSAGSYSEHNEWRRELATLAGYASLDDAWINPDPAKPFNELLDFADNEGVIGPIVSAKLARDFAAHQVYADQRGGLFAERYARWRKAFETAADGGAVDFH